MTGLWLRVGTEETDEDVVVEDVIDTDVVEGDVDVEDTTDEIRDVVVDTVVLEELLLGDVPSGMHVAPRAEASLKSSTKSPLETPYFVAAAEEIVNVAL